MIALVGFGIRGKIRETDASYLLRTKFLMKNRSVNNHDGDLQTSKVSKTLEVSGPWAA